MKKLVILFVLFAFLLSGCDTQEETPLPNTDTLLATMVSETISVIESDQQDQTALLATMVSGTLSAIQSEQQIPAITTTPTIIFTPEMTFTPSITFAPTMTVTPIAPLPSIDTAACVPLGPEPTLATVTRVIDGDTINVVINGQEFTVRYIGIDTPETVHPSKPVESFGPEASNKNKELVEGKEVILYKDVSETDQYDRLLRYIYVDGIFVNYELVKEGYANTSRYPPDVACADLFGQAEREAREAMAGLWGAEPTLAATQAATGSSSISIGYIFYDGVVSRSEPYEYVEIVNNGSAAVDLAGWSLHDEAGKTFRFPAYQSQPGESCRVYTNDNHPEYCGFSYYQNNPAIWNNGGDCATLKDSAGQIMDNKCY